MAKTKSMTVQGNLVFWDTHRHRWVEAIGAGVHKFLEHFVQTGFDGADAPAEWTTTLVEAGAGESTVALKAGADGGVLLLTTDAAENDGMNLQVKGEAFKLQAGDPCYFGARWKISEATQSDILIGLCITDTDLLGGMTDGAYFRKADGSTSMSAVLEKDSSETTGAALTVAADTFYITEFYFDGNGTVTFYVDGTAVSALAQTNLPDDEWLTPSIHFLAGDANARTAEIDWVRCIQITG